jgi:hypothetical protein
MGLLEKTDRIDAGVIAWYAEVKRIVAQQPAGEAQLRLTAFVKRLRQLTDAQVEQRNQRRLVTDPVVLASITTMLATIENQIRGFETSLAALIDADPLWHALDQPANRMNQRPRRRPPTPSLNAKPGCLKVVDTLRAPSLVGADFGPSLVVEAGASAAGVNATFGAVVSVFGAATDLTIKDFSILHVGSGGSVTDVVATSATSVYVSGTATEVTFTGPARLTVESGGVADTVVLGGSAGASGGVAIDRGTIGGVTVGDGWVLTVSSGGGAGGAVVNRGGAAVVSSGATASGTVVNGGGTATVFGGGTLDAATIVGGGLVSLYAGAVDTAAMGFVRDGGTLAWGGSGALGATLSGFLPGDTADLTALAFVSSEGATPDGLVLSVTEGGATDTLTFAAGTSFGGTAWKLAPDGHSGTDVTLVASA